MKKPLKIGAITKTILISYHVLLYAISYMLNPASVNLIVRNGVARHYFYLAHPNTFSMLVLWTSLEFLYIYYEKMKIKHIFIIVFVNVFFYLFTNTNTGILVISVVTLFCIADKMEFTFAIKLLHLISKYGFTGLAVTFSGICVIYPQLSGSAKEFIDTLNDFFTGRLTFGAYTYDVYGLSVAGRILNFPEKIYWRGHWIDDMVFDNAYIWLFVIYGTVYLVLIAFAFYWIANKTSTIEKILIVAVIFYGIMEAYIINIGVCFPLLFIGKYIYKACLPNKERAEYS